MEEENNCVMLKEKLEFFDILKEALKIPYKSIKFVFYTLLTSFPLFFMTLMYEEIFQRALVEASNLLDPPYGYFHRDWPIPTFINPRLAKEFSLRLVQLVLLYLVLLHLSELLSMVVIVSLASKIYTGGEKETPMTLKDMAIELIKKTRWEDPFITSFCVLCLSTSTLLGLIWLVTNYYIISRHAFYGYFLVIFYAVAFIILLKKYLEWSAVWNMSIVVSILEGIYGVQALMVSTYLCRGNEQQGLLLMLVFFVWGFGLRLSCLCVGCYERGSGVIAQVSLFCFGNVMKWVVCVVFYYDCKTRILEKRADEETREVENVDAEASTEVEIRLQAVDA